MFPIRFRSFGFGLVFCMVCLSAVCVSSLAQAPPGSPAAQSLEKWRESQWSMLRDDFGELARYRAADAALKSPAPGEHRVVFMGDSITDIWRIEDYFPGKPYINRGISGQTTPQMLVRFRQDVIDLQPQVVVILAGTNDIAGNTGPMRLEDIEANYASMAELAAAHGIQVILSSVTPIHDYTPRSQDFFAQRSPEKILALNAWLRSYCAKHDLIYLDYFSAMVDDKGMLKEGLSEDGLHPNATGFKVMAPLAEAAIEKALAARP